MIPAYPETYLNKVQSLLGEAFDYGINSCGIPGNDFIKLFTVTTLSQRLENGEAAVLAGRSGIEFCRDIVTEATGREPDTEPEYRFERSPEYWIGWAVAYYQWWSGRKFHTIFSVLSYGTLRQMYSVLHEADISKFTDIVDERIKGTFPETNLKRIRTTYGCSQSELANLSGVGLRSIQMYEQRNKDINKASGETIYRIARTLGCTMEDLLER